MDVILLRLAYEYAKKYSTDPSTQNGAVLINAENEPLVFGANHFPSNVRETKERWERPLKYSFVEHAERNVIYSAAKKGIKTDGLTMYCPWFACADCARAIIQAGIVEVVGHKFEGCEGNATWQDTISKAYEMLNEAGIKYRLYEGTIGVNNIRFNGSLVNR